MSKDYRSALDLHDAGELPRLSRAELAEKALQQLEQAFGPNTPECVENDVIGQMLLVCREVQRGQKPVPDAEAVLKHYVDR